MAERPTRRTQCIDGPRPCPYMSCRHHLGLDVEDGVVVLNRAIVDEEVPIFGRPTCSLDLADVQLSPADVAELVGATIEEVVRIEQVFFELLEQKDEEEPWRLAS